MKVIIFKAYNPLYDAEVVFRYNEHVISIIKKCFGCRFITTSKKWMVPANQVDELIKNLESADFEVIVDLAEENPFKTHKPYKSRWDSVDNKRQSAKPYSYKKSYDIPERIHANTDSIEAGGEIEEEKINSYQSLPPASNTSISRTPHLYKDKSFEPHIMATVNQNDGSLSLRLIKDNYHCAIIIDLQTIKGLILVDLYTWIVLPKDLAEFYALCDSKGYKLEYIL